MPELIAPAFLLAKRTLTSILVIPEILEKIPLMILSPIPGKVAKTTQASILANFKKEDNLHFDNSGQSGKNTNNGISSNSGQSAKSTLEDTFANSGHLCVQMTVK